MRRCTIPRHRGAVKRKKERGQESQFPNVLCSLPQSATKVWWALVLSAEGNTVAISLRTIAARAGISVTQTRRALKRLVATKLVEITEPGHGRKATVFRLRWQLPSFPQPFVPSSPKPLSQRSERRTPKETSSRPSGAAVQDFPIKRPSSALRWAMRRLRREVQSWKLPPPQQENLLRGLGAALWRALKKGLVHTTAQLRRLLSELLTALRSAPAGVSATLRRACGYGGAIVSSLLKDLRQDCAEVLRRRLEALRRLYCAPWLSPEERAAIAAEGKRLREELRGGRGSGRSYGGENTS